MFLNPDNRAVLLEMKGCVQVPVSTARVWIVISGMFNECFTLPLNHIGIICFHPELPFVCCRHALNIHTWIHLMRNTDAKTQGLDGIQTDENLLLIAWCHQLNCMTLGATKIDRQHKLDIRRLAMYFQTRSSFDQLDVTKRESQARKPSSTVKCQSMFWEGRSFLISILCSCIVCFCKLSVTFFSGEHFWI